MHLAALALISPCLASSLHHQRGMRQHADFREVRMH